MTAFQQWVANTIAELGGNPIVYLSVCNEPVFSDYRGGLVPESDVMSLIDDFFEGNQSDDLVIYVQKVCQSKFFYPEHACLLSLQVSRH